MSQKDYYAVLNLSPGAELWSIEAAYWRLARLYKDAPPGDPQAPLLLRDLNEAYEVLTSPQLRQAYDELLRSVAPRTSMGDGPWRRRWRWPRRTSRDRQEPSGAEDAAQYTKPPATEDSRCPPGSTPAAGMGPLILLKMPAADARPREPRPVRLPNMNDEGYSAMRWEMPAPQAFVAGGSIAVLTGIALAAGAHPALILLLDGLALMFCLLPWRFGDLPHIPVPRARARQRREVARRAASVRESTAAAVARWRDTTALSPASHSAGEQRHPSPPS